MVYECQNCRNHERRDSIYITDFLGRTGYQNGTIPLVNEYKIPYPELSSFTCFGNARRDPEEKNQWGRYSTTESTDRPMTPADWTQHIC